MENNYNFECFLRAIAEDMLNDPLMYDFYLADYYAICSFICPSTIPASLLPLGVSSAKMLYKSYQTLHEQYNHGHTKPLKLQKIVK